MPIASYDYSYLNEVIGSCSAALLAGAIPKIIPTVTATPNESKIENGLTMVGISANSAIPKAATKPKSTPMAPPEKLIITASKRN